ncbi:MAG: ABC transporter permease [Chloroflexi bacterium]|nr:ABC transporter permease [Chloroflexota bacterium]MDA1270969.1 ABC transporter permease [Chloroflexota bacterium]
MTGMIRFAYVMAVRRAVSGWRLEAVLFGGMLLAVALMASGVIFSDLLSNASLRHTLRQAPLEDVNFWMRSFSSQDEPATVEGRRAVYRERLDFAQNRVFEPFSPYLKEQARILDTATFYFRGHPQLELANEVRPRGSIIYMSGLTPDRVTLTQGSWLEAENAVGPSGSPVDVMVDGLGLELLGLEVGQVMDVYPAASFSDPPTMPVRIAGVFERNDPDDEFWFGVQGGFSLQNDRWTIIPLFTTEEMVTDQVLGVYPTLYTDVTWYYYLDRERLRASDVDQLQETVRLAEHEIKFNLKNSSSHIRLDTLLSSFDEQLLLARVPLFLVVFLITGILLYYLALVAGLVVRSRSNEIAMLKSRGATTAQVGILGLGEGLLLGIPAVIIGPFLAMGVVKVLGNVFFSLGGGSEELAGVPVSVSQGAVILGLAGGALAVAVFTLATLAAARHGIVEARQTGARPPTVSFLHRYYLDLLALALIGMLWWQIQSRGAFLVQSVGSRELEIDYSLLLGPVLGLLAVGLLVMRFFPWLALLLSWLSGPVAPSWLVHALRHVARDPMVPGMLIVLLTMATALGVIGSAFSATLERSQTERARYAAGADLRVRHSGVSSADPGGSFAETVQDNPAVAHAADVFRTNGQITATGFSTPATVLAVDASRIADVAWFRDDFSGGDSLQDIAGLLQDGGDPPKGIPLPRGATGLSIWVQPAGLDSGANLWARLRDANGRYFDTWIGGLAEPGWNRLDADLTPVDAAGRRFIDQTREVFLQAPYSLESFQVTNRFGTFGGDDLGSLFLGSLDAITPGGQVELADFRTARGWSVIQDFSRPGLYALETSGSAGGDRFPSSTRFSWASGGVGMRGFRPGETEAPVPAVVNEDFLKIADASVGDDVILGLSTYSLMVRIAGVANYFPTLDPGDKPFAVVDLDRLVSASAQHSPVTMAGANELWVDLAPSSDTGADPRVGDGSPVNAVDTTALIGASGIRVREVWDAEAMVASRVDQPLVNAGWGALLVLLFLAVAVASASGVMLFSFLDTKERQTEFALLRTLGSTGGQLRGIVWFNLFLIVICGVGLGTWVGQLIGASLLPLMEVVEEGERVTPPMVFTTDWMSLLVSYAVLAAVTAGTVVWLAWLSAKIQVQQVLRMGDAR